MPRLNSTNPLIDNWKERLLTPIAAFLFCVFIDYYFQISSHYAAEIRETLENLLGSLVSVMGAFLGFAITTISIVATLLNSDRFVRFTNTGQSKNLINEFLWMANLTAIYLVVLVFLAFTSDNNLVYSMRAALGFSLLWSFTYFRTMWIFKGVLEAAFPEKDLPEFGDPVHRLEVKR